ncbi:MAG: hypothetical protein WBM28_01735 [Burkholderiales bacterium]
MDEREERSYCERWGPVAAVHATVFRILRWWLGLRVCGIYVRPLAPAKSPDPAIPGFSYRLFEQGEADALIARAKRPELDLPEIFVRNALDKRDACHAILYDEEVVSYVWSAFTPTHDSEGVYVGFGDKDRYAYKALTLPEFRGRHLPRVFKSLRDGYGIARGCTHTIAFVAVENRSSIRSTAAQGYRRIGFAGYWKRGPFFAAFRTQGVRWRGFHFFVPLQEGAPRMQPPKSLT